MDPQVQGARRVFVLLGEENRGFVTILVIPDLLKGGIRSRVDLQVQGTWGGGGSVNRTSLCYWEWRMKNYNFALLKKEALQSKNKALYYTKLSG